MVILISVTVSSPRVISALGAYAPRADMTTLARYGDGYQNDHVLTSKYIDQTIGLDGL